MFLIQKKKKEAQKSHCMKMLTLGVFVYVFVAVSSIHAFKCFFPNLNLLVLSIYLLESYLLVVDAFR